MKTCDNTFTDYKKPWCYLLDGKLKQGYVVQDASDDETEIISTEYYDSDGSQVDPADYKEVPCPDCSQAQPVYMCNDLDIINPEAPDIECFPYLRGVSSDSHGEIVDNGNGTSTWNVQLKPFIHMFVQCLECCTFTVHTSGGNFTVHNEYDTGILGCPTTMKGITAPSKCIKKLNLIVNK